MLYKSASGGTEHLKIFKVSNLNTALNFLKTKDFWISAFDINSNKDFTKNNWKGKNVLLFGSEGYGIKTKDFWISAFDVSASKDFTKNNWKGKNVLLFGSEGFGIKAKTLENSDFRFKVNINKNIESLNISNTVSVVCHHIFQSIK